MRKFLPWIALGILLGTLVYAQNMHVQDQQVMAGYYQSLVPEATSFTALNDSIATAHGSSDATLAHVGIGSYVGYGGPLLVGVIVYPDASLGKPVILAHKETPSYLNKISQQGFYRQFESRNANDALTPGFDIDAISGATLSSQAIALSVNAVAHTIATEILQLTPQKASLAWQAGLPELAAAAVFALSLLASQVKKLARFRSVLLGGSVVILGFWLNRSFSVATVLAACLGFFPSVAQNLLWYIVFVGALLPALALGKNLYCLYVCPFCGMQELAHGISRVNLPVESLMKKVRPLRNVFLFAALFIGFLSLNPSCASYEPFGTLFGLNGATSTWNMLFLMLVASFFFRRFWCHLFCPAGAFLDFLAASRRSFGNMLCRKKSPAAPQPQNLNSQAAEGKVNLTIPPMPKKRVNPRPPKKENKIALLLFALFYAAAVASIVFVVWGNVQANFVL